MITQLQSNSIGLLQPCSPQKIWSRKPVFPPFYTASSPPLATAMSGWHSFRKGQQRLGSHSYLVISSTTWPCWVVSKYHIGIWALPPPGSKDLLLWCDKRPLGAPEVCHSPAATRSLYTLDIPKTRKEIWTVSPPSNSKTISPFFHQSYGKEDLLRYNI